MPVFIVIGVYNFEPELLDWLGLAAWPELACFGQPRNKSANLTNLKITESHPKIQQTT